MLDLVELEPVQLQLAFDYSEYSPQLAASLEQHALNMEAFTKRYAASMGKELAEAKAEIHAEKQTGWAKWVEGRLGITVQWADKIIRQYEKSKSETNFQISSPDIREATQEIEASNLVSAPSSLDFYQERYTPPEDEDEEQDIHLTEEQRYIAAVDDGYIEYSDDGHDLAKKRDAHVMQVMGSSESPEWYTPQEIVRLSIELLRGIDLDPCSNSHETPNVPALKLYTKEDNGLAQTWRGKVFLNPPYGSEIPLWVATLISSYEVGLVTEAVALLPARIDTQWFQPLYEENDCLMCHVRGRIQFENSPHHAPFPCVIAYLGKREDDFVRVFKHKGPIMRRIG